MRFCFLVASPPHRDLLLVPNICSSLPCGDRRSRGLKDEQWPPLQPSPAVRSTIPPGHRARLHGGENATPAREFCCISISVLFSLITRWSSFVGCELVKSAFSRLALVAAMVAIAPAGGSARDGRRKRGHVMEAKMSSTGA